jgi:hypothetical protein
MAKLKYHLARKSVKSFNACNTDKRKQHGERVSPLCYAPVEEPIAIIA